ncbi:hypothetical protein RSOLAG22IIIB_01269 [Rhizoctonia solani]|uniref:beta-glucosidase n=1 Tax=Rhizoctonia solani TaxID=456999 RepID=A0A0K6G543_9AGAM|nr:hypothetical protein RSOLAG22IIIB_01269 [Rhizoctonia solani]
MWRDRLDWRHNLRIRCGLYETQRLLLSMLGGECNYNFYPCDGYDDPRPVYDYQLSRSTTVPTSTVPSTTSPGATPTGAWATAITKAKAAVAKLTLAEKVSLGTGVQWQKGHCVGNIPAISSINFPGLCLQDSPLGVRYADKVSVFPAGINVAATFNRDLMQKRGAALGAEFKGKGVHVALGPAVNIARAPAAGRNWEGFGADPYLSGEASYETVIGIQSQGVQACAKHYINNEQEHFRESSSSNVDDRTQHEIYLPPFLKAVQAGVASFMCSYNQINGTYACENNNILNNLLKSELGFQGYVMSDWWATHSGATSVNAGLDMTMPGDITLGSGTTYFGSNLVNSVNSGQVSQNRINDLATRILAAWYLLGQDSAYPDVNFDSWNINDSFNKHIDVQGDHKTLIRTIGAASTVLLKNKNSALPLKTPSTIAVIGNDAGPNSKGINGCSDRGCNDGVLAQGWGSGTAEYPYLINPLDAIKTKASSIGATVTSSLSDSDTNAAVNAARGKDVALVFISADSGEGYITVEGNAGDRNNLQAWHNGDALVAAVAAVNKNTVVVVHTVGQIVMESWIDHANVTAVLWAGLQGQEAGNAVVDVLWGAVNPGGRLPYTIAKSTSDYSASVISSGGGIVQIPYTEGLKVDYRAFDSNNITPRFEFGFGLSYTTFEYSGLVVTPGTSGGTQPTGPGSSLSSWLQDPWVKVTFTLKNTGTIAGTEVPQLYISPPASSGEPPNALKGFDSVALQPGASTTVTMTLSRYDFSYWNIHWRLPRIHLWRQLFPPQRLLVGADTLAPYLRQALITVIVEATSTGEWAIAIAKAKKAVAKLTLAEKVSLGTGVQWQKGHCVGNTAAISSIDFPGLCLQDSPLGVRFADKVSVFPAGINIASTFNRDLMRKRGEALGAEFRGKGVHVALGPAVNITRVPAGGRNWEGFGADPYLAGEAAYETVVGIQSRGVQACAKHYINNEQETFRQTSSSNVDDRTQHEIYLPPFLKAVQAGVGSIMGAYNQVNGTYACENSHILNTTLKSELGFQGYVMSDWWATHSGAASVNAGLDMTMPGDKTIGSGTTYFGSNLVNSVKKGEVSQSRIDDLATRILAAWYLLGQDSGYPSVNFDSWDTKDSFNKHVDVQGDHKALIRTIGAASTVLLKNKNSTLPLKMPSTIAVIGSDAGPNPKGINSCADRGCNHGILAQGWGSGTAEYPYLINPLDAIKAKASSIGATVTSSLSDSDVDAAVDAARGKDVALVFISADSGEGYITVEGNEGDRKSLHAWHNGDALVEAVAAVNENTIVVVHTVGQIIMESWIDHANVAAVLWAGLQGQEAGNTVVDILWGAVNPSGRLPYTIAKSASDYSASLIASGTEIVQIPYKEGLKVDYRAFDANNISPRFEFGFGLSYTTFEYSNFNVTPGPTGGTQPTGPGSPLSGWLQDPWTKVTFTLKNTGAVAGTEIPQLYISPPASSGEPPNALKGFDSVYLQPGASTTVSMTLSRYDLSYWNVAEQKWSLIGGITSVWIGSSSRSKKLTATITI